MAQAQNINSAQFDWNDYIEAREDTTNNIRKAYKTFVTASITIAGWVTIFIVRHFILGYVAQFENDPVLLWFVGSLPFVFPVFWILGKTFKALLRKVTGQHSNRNITTYALMFVETFTVPIGIQAVIAWRMVRGLLLMPLYTAVIIVSAIIHFLIRFGHSRDPISKFAMTMSLFDTEIVYGNVLQNARNKVASAEKSKQSALKSQTKSHNKVVKDLEEEIEYLRYIIDGSNSANNGNGVAPKVFEKRQRELQNRNTRR